MVTIGKTIRMSKEMSEKLAFVAEYEGRSVNSHILVLIRESISQYEDRFGEIDGELKPDVVVNLKKRK